MLPWSHLESNGKEIMLVGQIFLTGQIIIKPLSGYPLRVNICNIVFVDDKEVPHLAECWYL